MGHDRKTVNALPDLAGATGVGRRYIDTFPALIRRGSRRANSTEKETVATLIRLSKALNVGHSTPNREALVFYMGNVG